MAFRCRTFLFVLIIICKYCIWRRTDVGPTSAGDINPTSKRRWADIARPISTQCRLNVGPTDVPLQFFSPHNLPELTLRRNRPNDGSNDQVWVSSGMVTDLLYPNMQILSILTLRQRQNGRHFTDDIFIIFNENIWISIKISLIFCFMVQLTT